MRSLPLSCLLLFCLTACTPPASALAPDPEKSKLTVMTYNVNFGIPGDTDTIDLMAQVTPDILLLQETTPAWEASLHARLGPHYPHMRFHHAPGAGGLAILSKHPIMAHRVLPPHPKSWFPAGLSLVQTPAGQVQVLNVHLRPPLSDSGSWAVGFFVTPKTRRQEIEAFTRALEPGTATIVAGDFNEGSGGRAIAYLHEALGHQSTLPKFHPGQSTWRVPTPLGEVGTQLDHITHDPSQLKVLHARVVRQGNSDHLPVVALFEAVR